MATIQLPTTTALLEPEGPAEDAHEHGIVLHQVEAPIPLVAEDADEDPPKDDPPRRARPA